MKRAATNIMSEHLLVVVLAIVGAVSVVVLPFLPAVPLTWGLLAVYAVPVLLVAGIDWAFGGTGEDDFGLPLDIALAVLAPALITTVVVAARRYATLARGSKGGLRPLRSAMAAVVPAAVLSGVVATSTILASRAGAAPTALGSLTISASVGGLAYVVIDYWFARWLDADEMYLPWVSVEGARTHWLLWLADIAVAVLVVLMWVQNQPILAAFVAVLLVGSLRIANGLLSRVQHVYAATAEALVAALAATLPRELVVNSDLANDAAVAAELLGLPFVETNTVRSAAWLFALERVGRDFDMDFADVLCDEAVLPPEMSRVVRRLLGRPAQSPTRPELIATLVILECARRRGLASEGLSAATAHLEPSGVATAERVVANVVPRAAADSRSR